MVYDFPTSLLDHFQAGMDRVLPDLIPTSRNGIVVNLGAGKKQIKTTVPLDLPWCAGSPMPFSTDSVASVIAYHFFEHLTKDELTATLRECERVLKVGGTINIVVPHWSGEAAHQDLDHKSFFSESTWKNFFNNRYYEGTMPRDWKLSEHMSFLFGWTQRNLAVFSQLVRVKGV